jgi:hypothetical protein
MEYLLLFGVICYMELDMELSLPIEIGHSNSKFPIILFGCIWEFLSPIAWLDLKNCNSQYSIQSLDLIRDRVKFITPNIPYNTNHPNDHQ